MHYSHASCTLQVAASFGGVPPQEVLLALQDIALDASVALAQGEGYSFSWNGNLNDLREAVQLIPSPSQRQKSLQQLDWLSDILVRVRWLYVCTCVHIGSPIPSCVSCSYSPVFLLFPPLDPAMSTHPLAESVACGGKRAPNATREGPIVASWSVHHSVCIPRFVVPLLTTVEVTMHVLCAQT